MKINFIKVTALAVTAFSLLSCSSKNKAAEEKELRARKNSFEMYQLLKEDKAKKNAAVRKYVSELSLEEKLSQVFMINLEKDDRFFPVEWYDRTVKTSDENFKSSDGTVNSSDGTVKKIKTTLIPAGYIFFGYNVSKNPETIISFTDSITEYALKENSIPAFLSIDVEGGFVNRLRGVAGPLAENERVASCLTPTQAYKLYSLYGTQLQSLGFNLNLAPVAEINSENNKEFLSGRSYGDEKQVVEYCSKAVNAYQNKNVGTVLKHFPGNTNIDPHIGLPKIDMTEQEFNQIKKIFSEAIKNNPDGVLMSHAIVPAFDKDPACLSKFWIKDVMRDELGFEGIIFSDDIFMGALIDNGYSPAKASKMAIDAGINCIMISEKKFGRWMELLISICNEEPEFLSKIEESVVKILEFKIRHNIIKLEYDKACDAYSVRLLNSDETDFSKEKQKDRFNSFENAKKETVDIYNEYFKPTASEEEKRALNIQ